MGYSAAEIAYTLELMTICECSVYNITNLKSILELSINCHPAILKSFYYTCLEALGRSRLISLSDIENVLGLIHQNFNKIEPTRHIRIKILESIRQLMLYVTSLTSFICVHDIPKIYNELKAVFKIQTNWLPEAKEVLTEHFKSVKKKPSS
jgi:hypothetical protein